MLSFVILQENSPIEGRRHCQGGWMVEGWRLEGEGVKGRVRAMVGVEGRRQMGQR